MATSNLLIDEIEAGSAQKETVANEAFEALDNAGNRTAVVEVAGASPTDVTIPTSSYRRNKHFDLNPSASDAPANTFNVLFPKKGSLPNSDPEQRSFLVTNDTGVDARAKLSGNDDHADDPIIAPGTTQELYSDGMNLILVGAGNLQIQDSESVPLGRVGIIKVGAGLNATVTDDVAEIEVPAGVAKGPVWSRSAMLPTSGWIIGTRQTVGWTRQAEAPAIVRTNSEQYVSAPQVPEGTIGLWLESKIGADLATASLQGSMMIPWGFIMAALNNSDLGNVGYTVMTIKDQTAEAANDAKLVRIEFRVHDQTGWFTINLFGNDPISQPDANTFLEVSPALAGGGGADAIEDATTADRGVVRLSTDAELQGGTAGPVVPNAAAVKQYSDTYVWGRAHEELSSNAFKAISVVNARRYSIFTVSGASWSSADIITLPIHGGPWIFRSAINADVTIQSSAWTADKTRVTLEAGSTIIVIIDEDNDAFSIETDRGLEYRLLGVPQATRIKGIDLSGTGVARIRGDVLTFVAPFTHLPALDFDLDSLNSNAQGIWSDGITLWVADSTDDKLYAYTLATKARDPNKDFDTLAAAGNTSPRGIWSDGITLWVADSTDDKIYAYTLATKARDPNKDFNTLAAAGNTSPQGLWSDGVTLWIVEATVVKIYAYSLATKARDPNKDFNTLVAGGNNHPFGTWSDGVTLWVADSTDDKLYAYSLATKVRDPNKDFNTLVAAGNAAPVGLWSDGTTMWVADDIDDKIYAYAMP